MTLHYLKIALRNIRKYKVQNLVSILSIAASAALLTVVGSVLSELKIVEILEQPYGDRAVDVRFLRFFADEATEKSDDQPVANFYNTDPAPEVMRIALSKKLQTVERIIPMDGNQHACEVFAKVADQERSMALTTQSLPADFLQWWGVRSYINNKECAPLEKGTTILTAPLALRLFGRVDVIGETIALTDLEDETQERQELRIVDVVAPSAYNMFALGKTLYTCSDGEPSHTWSAYMQLREGATVADLQAELDKVLKDSGGFAKVEPVEKRYSEILRFFIPTCHAIMLFLALFLGVCVVGYMRMQAQLFRIRQREIALRTVVGARRWQLVVQFSVEVLIILALAFCLTLAFNSFLRSFLNENFAANINELWIPFKDLMPRSLATYIVVAVLCLAVVWFVIRSIRRRQTGLALMMHPSRRSFASVATMSVQMFFSTLFIAVLVFMVAFVRYQLDKTNIPSNDDYYRRCIILKNMTFDGNERELQMVRLVEEAGNVERVFRYDDAGDMIALDTIGEQREYCVINFQTGTDMLDFYGQKPVITNPKANPLKRVFVSQVLKEAMERGGAWQLGYVDIMMERYDIAGWFERRPYLPDSQQQLIIANNANRPEYASQYYFVAKPLCYAAAQRDIADAFEQVFPGDLSYTIHNYRSNQAQELSFIEMLKNMFAIIVAISIITTIASLYSVISLDTRRRRKEVALRKIHGATAWVIARLFLRRYVLILAACAVLILPILLVAGHFADFESLNLKWWHIWLATIATISLITALTIGWKIRDIARLNPAEWLKE